MVALVFSYVFGVVGFLPGVGGLRGSGNLVTETVSITGFTSVSAAMGFNVEITESSTFSVRVTLDDNLVDKLRVTKVGNTLSLSLDPGSYLSRTLRAVITMPAIEGIDFSGGSRGSISEFAGLASLDLGPGAGET